MRNARSSKVVPKAFCFGLFVVKNPLGIGILDEEGILAVVVVVEGVVVVVPAVEIAEGPADAGPKTLANEFTDLGVIGLF